MIPGWLDEIEEEVSACVCAGRSMSLGDLAKAMNVSERCALDYVTLLASAGRLRIERISLPPAAGREGAPRGVLVGRLAA